MFNSASDDDGRGPILTAKVVILGASGMLPFFTFMCYFISIKGDVRCLLIFECI